MKNKSRLITLYIQLAPWEIEPPVWRRLEVDGNISLGKLHHFLQAVFGWHDAHLHEFSLGGVVYGQHDPKSGAFDSSVIDERK